MGKKMSKEKVEKLDLDEIRKEFKKVDENGDGKIQREELVNVLVKVIEDQGFQKLLIEEIANEVFDRLDKDKDGTLDFDEFCDKKVLMKEMFED